MTGETAIDAFAAALADPAAPPPVGTRGRSGVPDARRFSVYRNNIAVGLIGALEARFPVARRMADEGLFREMARAFARSRKPRSPVMIAYGDDFPDFARAYLEAKGAGGDLPGLADVMRLENAWVGAYHAKDEPVATIADLGSLNPAALPLVRAKFHAAARLLRFSSPAASIWAAHQGRAELAEPTAGSAEDALVTRPDAEVTVRILPPGGYDFAAQLHAGATLADAAEGLADPGQFGTHLVGLVDAGAIRAIVPGEPA